MTSRPVHAQLTGSRRRLSAIGHGSAFESIEDELDARIEFSTEVVAGLEDMVDSELGQVGEAIWRHLFGDGFGKRSHLSTRRRREGGLLEGEAIEERVDHGVSMASEPEGEPGLPETAEDGVVMPQSR